MIGIIGAMAEEVAAFAQEMQDKKTHEIAGIAFHVGHIHGVKVVLAQSGIGKVNAAMTTTLMCQQFAPKAIINTGSAGGFNSKQQVGDIIVSIDVVHHDVDVTAFGYTVGQVPGMPSTFAAAQTLIDIAHQALAELALPAHKGQVASGDKFMTHQDHIDIVRQQFPNLDAVEMEGAAIAQVCHRFETPFVIVRALSDIAGKASPMSFEQFLPLAAENAAKLIVTMLPHVAKQFLA
ncbi:MAG: 5'-methylthioadenosine/adenosylhomocysteine nucleosidase [Proteobacteria bacterium]|nr:5'-methylthioadenosine/adenosylhomocysteine nucleosidase [Pseudomonadota bacterium]